MRALVLESPGAPFTLTEVPRPTAAPGQVLVRIKASGVNPLDTKIRAGQAAHARVELPAILGMDMAGVVEAVGPGVTTFHPGDEVYGMVGGIGGLQGTLAEFVAVDADLLAIKAANLSMREAAALPLVFITAWEGLVDRAQVQRRAKSAHSRGGRRRRTRCRANRSRFRRAGLRHCFGRQKEDRRSLWSHRNRLSDHEG